MNILFVNKSRKLRKSKLLLIALTVLITCYYSVFCFADPTLIIDADKQFEFAKECFSKGYYLQAADEFRRFIWFFPQNPKVKDAMFKIGESYFKAGQFQDSIKEFDQITKQFPQTLLCIESWFMIGESWINLGQSGQAITTFNNIIILNNDIKVKDKAYYKLAWVYLDLMKKNRYTMLELSLKSFNCIINKNDDVKKIIYSLEKLKIDPGLIPEKNPSIAGALSIIPGLGYFYCNRYQDSLASFLLNTGLIFGAYKSFEQDNPALGSVIGVVELGFYSGNIWGSINSAHKYNNNQIKKFIGNVKADISNNYKERKVFLIFSYDF